MTAMTDTEQTLEEILNLAAAQFKVPREKLAPDDDFFKTLGIDSLQALDLLTRLEHHSTWSFRTTNCREFRTFEPWPADSGEAVSAYRQGQVAQDLVRPIERKPQKIKISCQCVGSSSQLTNR